MHALSAVGRARNLKTSPHSDHHSNDSLRPADECPWRRPFPEGFDECPVFVPQSFVPTDSRDRPLPAVLTCRHLVSRSFNLPKVGWYGACEIGDAAARRAYLRAPTLPSPAGGGGYSRAQE